MTVKLRARGKRIGAFLLSLMLPGLVHAYLGRWCRGLALFFALALLWVPLPALIALGLPPRWIPIAIGMVLLVSVWVWVQGAWNAATAVQGTEPTKPSRERRSLALALFVLAYPAAFGGLNHYVRAHWVESFAIASDGMSPALVEGDWIFVDKGAACLDCRNGLRQGDIIVFRSPEDPKLRLIKRIAGLPGDRIQNESDPEAPGRSGTVPPRHLFLLGDNLGESRDSRDFGAVPVESIVGRARTLWMSISKEDGVRWNRIGTSLERRAATDSR